MIKNESKGRFTYFYFNFTRRFLPSIPLILGICLAACSTPSGSFDSQGLAQKAAIEAVSPVLNKLYLDQAPIRPPSLSTFPLVDSLPGKPFKGGFRPRSVSYDSNGILLLAPGDYVIPVMTYCMNVSGSSPPGFIYVLSQLQGKRADLIQELNQRAFPRFSPNDVQILSWSLQAGFSYEELTPKSQQILDTVLPERRKEIEESFLKKFQQEWDRISDKTDGLFPAFDGSSDKILDQMGEAGQKVQDFREFQSDLRQYGNDYSQLSRMIDAPKSIAQAPRTTPWSKINDQVYARFVTGGEFQEIGQVQIRVVSVQKRMPSSSGSLFVPVNISSWVADPRDSHIQPLSFSMILSTEGILLVPEIAHAPVIAAALLGAILASNEVDWDLFRQLKNYLADMKDARVRGLIHNGDIALQKAYDDLEKPVKEAGIIGKNKTKKTPESRNSDTREYKKPGGVEQLEKDFDKLPGESKLASDGIPIKELPDGKTAVKRLPREGRPPILEIQPQQTGNKSEDRLRVKVRYTP